MINALLSQNLVVLIYALFPPIFQGWQIVPAIFVAFWMYELTKEKVGCGLGSKRAKSNREEEELKRKRNWEMANLRIGSLYIAETSQ